MPQINDAINAAIPDSGAVNAIQDKLLRYYQANGATSNDLQDAERQFLFAVIPGSLEKTNQEMWFNYLRVVKGFTGSLDDMLYTYWVTGPRP